MTSVDVERMHWRSIRNFLLPSLLAVLWLPACIQGHDVHQTPASTAELGAGTTAAKVGQVFVLLKTNRGDIALELDSVRAPATVRNFLEYMRSGFYDGTVFHEVLPGSIVQAGTYDANFERRHSNAPIKNESTNGLKNVRGSISMACDQAAHSATSQFFVNLRDNDSFDSVGGEAGSAVFGRVIRGMDILDAIAASPTGDKIATVPGDGSVQLNNVPLQTVTILSVQQVTSGEAKGTGGPASVIGAPNSPFTIER